MITAIASKARPASTPLARTMPSAARTAMKSSLLDKGYGDAAVGGLPCGALPLAIVVVIASPCWRCRLLLFFSVYCIIELWTDDNIIYFPYQAWRSHGHSGPPAAVSFHSNQKAFLRRRQ